MGAFREERIAKTLLQVADYFALQVYLAFAASGDDFFFLSFEWPFGRLYLFLCACFPGCKQLAFI